METITFSALIALLQGLPGTVFCSFIAKTDSRALKTGNPCALPVWKTNLVRATIGADYEKAVNREAERQDKKAAFVAGSLPKGRNWLVPGKVLVSDCGTKFYLRQTITPGQRRHCSAKRLGFQDANGAGVSEKTIAPFLPTAAESDKQQRQTGISQTVFVRDWLFTGLLSIKINGTRYRVTP